MSDKERNIILISCENRSLTQKQIALKVGCARSYVSYTLKRYRQGFYTKSVPLPSLSRVELSICAPSKANQLAA